MKIVLARKWSVGGVIYGPGEVDVPERVAATLTRRGAHDNPLAAFPMLITAGITSLKDAQAQTDEQLLAIDGVGPAVLKRIREAKG